MRVLTLILLALAALLFWWWPRYDYLPAEPVAFTVERIADEPLIHAGLSARLSEVSGGAQDYVNINGPALIRVPDWLPDPLGKYYLYFAHHKGDHMRMAYADSLTGPWTVYEPGVLALEDAGFPSADAIGAIEDRGLEILRDNFSPYIVRDMLLLAYRAGVTDQKTRAERGIEKAANSLPHVASPEVVVDQQNRRLIMYYHGLAGKQSQYTHMAQSQDGLSFNALPGTIYSNYLRVFEHRGQWFGLTMPGILYRSADGLSAFAPRAKLLFEPNMRHAGLWLAGDTLYVFWSRVGDAPERILLSEVDLSSPNWDDWRATEPVEVMRARLPWEGGELEPQSSLRGELGIPANELRDPYVFADDGQLYLFYVGGGEQAIGLARLDAAR